MMVPPHVQDVAHRVHLHLVAERIPHAVIGGIAVGVYGYDRTTRDVDLLVNHEDLRRLPGRPLANVKGKTFKVDGVDVDVMAAPRKSELFRGIINQAVQQEGLPIIPLHGLLLLKLLSTRISDLGDVERLLMAQSPTDVGAIRQWLRSQGVGRDIVADFDLAALSAVANREGARTNPARKELRDRRRKRAHPAK